MMMMMVLSSLCLLMMVYCNSARSAVGCQCYGWQLGWAASDDEHISQNVWFTLVPNDYSAEQFLQFSALFHSKGWLALQSGIL